MIYTDYHFIALLIIFVLDRLIGDPVWLWGRISHPVVWMGKAIGFLERQFNLTKYSPSQRQQYGMIAMTLLIASTLSLGYFLHQLGLVVELLVASIFLAGKSLLQHLSAIYRPLKRGEIETARQALAKIVGRDTKHMDESGIAKAAIESAAENLSDGLIAPLFWYGVLGLPGLLTYKLVNTADSMIGYKNERFLHYGFFAAKCDDWLNWMPARLTAILIAILALKDVKTAKRCFRVMAKDAPKHASPNAGYPEAAMAGLLNITLGGKRSDEGVISNAPLLNPSGKKQLQSQDLARAIKAIYFCLSMVLLGLALVAFLQFAFIFQL